MFVIEDKLSLSYWRVKSMHYPESPKVTNRTQTVMSDKLLFLVGYLANQSVNRDPSCRNVMGKQSRCLTNFGKLGYRLEIRSPVES